MIYDMMCDVMKFQPKFCYGIEKRIFFSFFPPDEKDVPFHLFLKILQAVHARNRPIQQPFVQCLVEPNYHQ